MMKFDDITEWMDEVRRIARLMSVTEAEIAELDERAWEECYFDEGMTPAEAWDSELEAGLG